MKAVEKLSQREELYGNIPMCTARNNMFVIMKDVARNLAHAVKLTPPQAEREFVNPKVSIPAYGTVTSDRPYICPYEGCDKCYIHEYKLNLHLRREHAGYAFEENGKHESDSDDEMD